MTTATSRRYTFLSIVAIAAGVLLHFTFGYFYTVSNMVNYILGYIGNRVNSDISSKYAIWLSAIALCVQGFSMPFGGIFARKFGFRWTVIISSLSMSGGVLLTYLTIQYSFIGTVFTYSFIVGAGLGFGYSVVIAVATSWYPHRRGLIVGLIVAGFGAGALVFTPIQTALINPMNLKANSTTKQFDDARVLNRVPIAFLYLGAMLLFLQVIGCIFIRPKPTDNETRVERNEEPKEQKPNATEEIEADIAAGDIPPMRAVRSLEFVLLWLLMFCNIIPVTFVTAIYKQYGQQQNLDDRFLSIVVTISSVFNAGGRIAWGFIVDHISFKIPLILMHCIWALVLFVFPHIHLINPTATKVLFTICVFVMYLMLSGVFVLMPAATGNLFGQKYLAVNYGLVFNAFAFGSLLSAILVTFVDVEGRYMEQFTACGVVCVIGAFITCWITDDKMPRRLNWCQGLTSMCKRARAVRRQKPDSLELQSRSL